MPVTPQAKISHHVVMRYNTPGSPLYQGLIIPENPDGSLPYAVEAYNQFAPQLRQGDATDSDRALLSAWEIFKSQNGGMGKVFEEAVEMNTYFYASGTPALYTAQEGHVLPPPAVVTVDTARKDIKQFLFCAFSGGSKFMALSNAAAGIVYSFDSTGVTLTAVETLTAAGKHMVFDGTTLFVTQGSSNAVRKTTDGTTFSNHTFNADYVAVRENGVLAYVGTSGGNCVLTPGGTDTTINIGTSAPTNLISFAGALWIGKPEGLWRWAAGHTGDSPFFAALEFYSTDNCKFMAVHNNLLYFNMGNRLFYTNGQTGVFGRIEPKEINGYETIDALTATAGPLLIAAHTRPGTTSSQEQQSQILYMESVNNSGLNPLMAAAVGAVSSAKSPGAASSVTWTAGDTAWINPSNAITSDNSYATVTGDGVNVAELLYLSTLGFAVPTGATITGIVARVEAKHSVGGSSNALHCAVTKTGIGADPSGFTLRTITPTTSDAVYILGTTTDLWGQTLSVADVNASTFGLFFYVVAAGMGSGEVTSIDDVVVTVYYNIGGNTYAAVGATTLFDTNGVRVYFCESDSTNGNGVRYLNMSPRFRPLTYDIRSAANQYNVITEFTASLPVVHKWGFDVVVAVRNTSSTTFAMVEYSTNQGGTWTKLQDSAGADISSMTLSSEYVGGYFPNNVTWTRLMLRYYMWTTDPSSSAEIIRLTARGLVMTDDLYKFSFPVDCGQMVSGFTTDFNGQNAENGDVIMTNLRTMAGQKYPVDLQDIRGNWHRVVFQPPSPIETITEYHVNQLTGDVSFAARALINLIEIIPLSGATGTLPTWAVNQ